MRSKALKLAAALALSIGASLLSPPAQALQTCNCTYCLPDQGWSCVYKGVMMSCQSYVRSFCLG